MLFRSSGRIKERTTMKILEELKSRHAKLVQECPISYAVNNAHLKMNCEMSEKLIALLEAGEKLVRFVDASYLDAKEALAEYEKAQ